MHLYTSCPKCLKKISISTNASDRFVLARKIGEKFPANCEHCGSRVDIHVNEVKAELGKTLSLIAGIIFLVGTTSLLIWFWEYLFQTSNYSVLSFLGIIIVPYLIYNQINRSQRERVKYFNSKWYG